MFQHRGLQKEWLDRMGHKYVCMPETDYLVRKAGAFWCGAPKALRVRALGNHCFLAKSENKEQKCLTTGEVVVFGNNV